MTLGRDRIDNDNNPLVSSDAQNEHGTAVWSLIGARAGNNIGIDGINDRAPVWLGRASGSGQWDLSLTDFVSAVKAQGQQNAIANLSLDLTQVDAEGTVTTRYELTPRERAALEYARQNGVLVVVAAGNDGGLMSVLGQASQEFDNIMTVGAFDGVRRSPYSSYGYGLDAVVAEGENDLDALTGTSFAAAKATGMASVVWENNPELSDRQVIDILKQSAIDVNLPGWDRKTGFGLLNLDKAVQLAKETSPQQSSRAEFATPETWGYEGLVKPMERATATEFNGKSYDWQAYTIKTGDTLSEIAKETMGSAAPDYYKFIAKHNKIDNPNVIYVGQKIEIPKEVAASDGGGSPIDKPEQQSPNSISIGGHNIAGKFYPVYEKYQSTIGKPTSDVTNYSGNVRYQLFERGSIVSSSKGTFPIYGAIRQEYLKTGGLEGRLGVPKSGEIDRGNGNKIQYFEGGHIYWNGHKATAYQEPGKPSKPDNNNSGENNSGGNKSDCYELGSLSEKYETGNRGPGTIGGDPTGGPSYGTYQLATKPGSLAGFLNSEIASKWSSELKPLTPGTKAFDKKWQEIASKDAKEFGAAQHEYIKITHYDPLANKLKKTLDLDVNKHSKALQNVIWSTAVQHGANTTLVNNALKGKNISQMSESELINAIYAERGKKDSAGTLVYFSSSPRSIQKSVANRFVDERSDALAMLQNPCSGDTNAGESSNGGTKPPQPGLPSNPDDSKPGESNSGGNNEGGTKPEKPRTIPDGFQRENGKIGVDLYKKDSDYVQIVDLSKGASVNLLHGEITKEGDSPDFKNQTIEEAWSDFSGKNSRGFSVTNGQFFGTGTLPNKINNFGTRLNLFGFQPFAAFNPVSHPLKIDGKVISQGFNTQEEADSLLMLELFGDRATVKDYDRNTFDLSLAKNILVSYDPIEYGADRNEEQGRTFIGVGDLHGSDGINESVLLFSSDKSTQKNAGDTLINFGANQVMMLDGSGSSQLNVNGKTILSGDSRKIPQTIGVVGGFFGPYLPRKPGLMGI